MSFLNTLANVHMFKGCMCLLKLPKVCGEIRKGNEDLRCSQLQCIRYVKRSTLFCCQLGKEVGSSYALHTRFTTNLRQWLSTGDHVEGSL